MADNMDIDMDVDLVVDEEEDEELAQLRAQAEAARARATEAEASVSLMATDEAPEEGELADSGIVPNKVFICGLDAMTTSDVRNFITDHFSLDNFKRVEWIDDTSANLIFDNDETAAAALQAFSTEAQADLAEATRAKQLTTHPNAELRVRIATTSDVKQPGAKDRSRFYLLNPEYDPDMRPQNGKRRRPRNDRGNESFKRRRNDESILSRRSSVEETPFNVDFYDDDAGESKAKPNSNGRSQKPRNQELFAGKSQGRLRDRSASPVADGDGKYGFEESHPYRRTARRRSSSPRGNRSPRRGKELFSDKQTSLRANGNNATKELFPNGLSPQHKRSDAQDLHPNQVADIIGKYTFFGTASDAAYGRPDQHPEGQKRDLFSRITGGPGSKASSNVTFSSNRNGRLKDDGMELEGFSILGASRDRTENPLVKELFPLKMQAKNNGQDLFDGRVKGRASQRRRAEDLF